MYSLPKSLFEDIYTHEDLRNRCQTAKKVFEHMFYKDHANKDPIKKRVAQALRLLQHTERDQTFIAHLIDKEGLITKVSFYSVLKQIERDALFAPVIVLRVARIFEPKQSELISVWLRKHLHPQLFIRFSYDKSIIAGCRLSWNNKNYDFSLAQKFNKQRPQIRSLIATCSLKPNHK